MPVTENVQLTGKERTVVYRDLDSSRILGFGIDGAPPINAPQGIRYETIVVYHARDLDRFMDQYREQHIRDEETAVIAKLEREKGFRQANRDAILARNAHLDPFNRHINLRMLEAQDRMYEETRMRRLRAIPRLAAEMYEQGGDDTRIVKDALSGSMTK